MEKWIALALFLTLNSAFAKNCDNETTTAQMNICAKQSQAIVEAKLNQEYKKVLKLFPTTETEPNNAAIKAGIIGAQRAWIKFREADCQAVYTLYQEGTMRAMVYLGCMRARAAQRITELKTMLVEYN